MKNIRRYLRWAVLIVFALFLVLGVVGVVSAIADSDIDNLPGSLMLCIVSLGLMLAVWFGLRSGAFAITVMSFLGALGLGLLPSCSGRPADSLCRGSDFAGTINFYIAMGIVSLAIIGLYFLYRSSWRYAFGQWRKMAGRLSEGAADDSAGANVYCAECNQYLGVEQEFKRPCPNCGSKRYTVVDDDEQPQTSSSPT
jgi:hypothetical protein